MCNDDINGDGPTHRLAGEDAVSVRFAHLQSMMTRLGRSVGVQYGSSGVGGRWGREICRIPSCGAGRRCLWGHLAYPAYSETARGLYEKQSSSLSDLSVAMILLLLASSCSRHASSNPNMCFSRKSEKHILRACSDYSHLSKLALCRPFPARAKYFLMCRIAALVNRLSNAKGRIPGLALAGRRWRVSKTILEMLR